MVKWGLKGSRKKNPKVETEFPTTDPRGYAQYMKVYMRRRYRRLNNVPRERWRVEEH